MYQVDPRNVKWPPLWKAANVDESALERERERARDAAKLAHSRIKGSKWMMHLKNEFSPFESQVSVERRSGSFGAVWRNRKDHKYTFYLQVTIFDDDELLIMNSMERHRIAFGEYGAELMHGRHHEWYVSSSMCSTKVQAGQTVGRSGWRNFWVWTWLIWTILCGIFLWRRSADQKQIPKQMRGFCFDLL